MTTWDSAAGRVLFVEAAPDRLRLRLEIAAAAPAEVALPGGARQWLPAQVLLDGRPATALGRAGSGQLWLHVPAGGHMVVLEGPLPARDVVQIPLPQRPHGVTASLRGWKIDGLGEDGEVAASLQLGRVATRTDAAPGTGLEPTSLPPFVWVERTLRLGLKWTVETRVLRATPPGVAVLLSVPLLAGESVVTEGVRVVGGKVQVTMGPGEASTAWRGVLEQRAEIRLAAQADGAFAEVWQLDMGPMWHATFSGIPPVLPQGGASVRLPEWRPWPAEAATIAVARPEGTAGQTLTVDRSVLELRPGRRSTAATLTLDLRSSRGGQHRLTLPPSAQLESLALDGRVQPVRQDGDQVTLALVPGRQNVTLTFRDGAGLGAFYRAPVVSLAAGSVNADVRIAVPPERWVLLAGGPRLGPAVLFWSVLVIVGLCAAALGRFSGRTSLTPLATRHWLLLGVGLSQVPVPAAAMVAATLLALGWRRRHLGTDKAFSNVLLHNAVQVALAFAIAISLVVLFSAVRQGLLAAPDMRISGNLSTAGLLRWFSDRTADELPRPWVVSVPLLGYRLAMLAWALWLALAIVRWSRWAWSCLGEGGLWRPLRVK